MGTATKTLQERIKELEKQRQELILRRKDEIFEIINANGGIGLDNRLIAGFVVYAASEENKDNDFLLKLKELGSRMRFPKRRQEQVAKRAKQSN